MTELLTTYFFVKYFVYNVPLWFWSYCDFTLWSLFLTFPKFVAVSVAVATSQNAKILSNLIGKYADQCCDDWNSLKVWQKLGLQHNESPNVFSSTLYQQKLQDVQSFLLVASSTLIGLWFYQFLELSLHI